MKNAVHFLAILAGVSAMIGSDSFQSHAAMMQGPDACRQTTENALRSCRSAAQSDFWLASGKCANVTDRSDRRDCQQEASVDQRDALIGCDDQRDARQVVCRRLGGGPYDPEIDPSDFVTEIDNPHFPLVPGTTFIFEGETPRGLERDTFAVTHATRVIAGVTCVEVHDTVTLDGAVIEDTLDWFAQDEGGNVWYFGENSNQLAGGLVTGTEGSWTAGVDGAKPGLIMRAHPRSGDFYRQEFSLGVAEDIGEVIRLHESVIVPYGSFDGCVETEDTTPLDPESLEHKFYAPGIGVVLEVDPGSGERLELVGVTTE